MKIKRGLGLLLPFLLVCSMLFSIVGCSSSSSSSKSDESASSNAESPALDLNQASWEEILEAAKGSTVSFYGWGGDENRNAWLKNTLSPYLQERYGLKLEVVGMNIEDILAKLASEKASNTQKGSIDAIWINGENFYSAKENGLLYGPFTHKLPNMQELIDNNDPETLKDFSMPIEGYEAPYGKAQLVFYHDSARSPESPKSAQELLEFAKKYPQKLSYPALPDFTGSAFVRNIIYELCGWEQFQDMPADYDTVKAAIEPALSYLRDLNPYLWNEGKNFPDSSTTLDSMFADGELMLSMSYAPFTVATNIDKGIFSPTSKTFVFDKGTIGNTNYIAIASNSPNKAGAMVLINAIISAEMQLIQYQELRTIPVVDGSKLSTEQKAAFDAVDLGQGVLTQEELLEHRLPEMPAKLVPVIEKIWLDEVVAKYNK